MSLWPAALIVIAAAYLLHVMILRRRLHQRMTQIVALEQHAAELERKLERRKQRLDVLFDAVNEAVLRVDHEGQVRAANRRAAELFHPQGGIRLPQPMLAFYRDPEWQRSFACSLAALPQPASLPPMQVRDRVLLPRLAPLGRRQALLLCLDATQQARLEHQRQSLLANLMHDLKTPLTSLLGYSRSLQTMGDDPKLRAEATQVIADEAKHVNRLLDELLTLEQIEHGQIVCQGSCELPQVWRQVADALEAHWQSKNMQVRVALAAGLPPLAIGEGELRRLLTNVVENAIRHTPPQTRIDVTAERQGDVCRIEVCDNGPGIPAKHLARVTERFYCVDRARSRSFGGHGLGLAIVEEILKQSGGSLTLHDAEPHGLRVIMQLPLAATSMNQAA